MTKKKKKTNLAIRMFRKKRKNIRKMELTLPLKLRNGRGGRTRINERKGKRKK